MTAAFCARAQEPEFEMQVARRGCLFEFFFVNLQNI